MVLMAVGGGTGSSAVPDFTVGTLVRVNPGTHGERRGVVVEDFGVDAGRSVDVGRQRIADPSRRWAVILEDGDLVFVDGCDLGADQPRHRQQL